MRAGDRDTLISFLRDGATIDDGYTTLPGDDTVVGVVKARVFYGAGSEQRQMASQEGAVQAVTFQVPASTLTRSVKVDDQIREELNRFVWDIQGIAYRGRTMIEFTAKRGISTSAEDEE